MVVNTTHIIPFDAPKIGRFIYRARCGRLVHQDLNAKTAPPTCKECAQLDAEDEQALAQLREPDGKV